MDLYHYSSKFLTLLLYDKATAQICTDLQNRVSIAGFSYSCKQANQSTLMYLFEIEANHDNIWSSFD